jgi:hydrogenase/urease accessory protein HupE
LGLAHVRIAAFTALILFACTLVDAHEIGTTQVRLAVGNGRWSAQITTAPQSLLDKLESAAVRPRVSGLTGDAYRNALAPLLPAFAGDIAVSFDGVRAPAQVSIEQLEQPDDITRPAFVVIRAEGTMPASAKTLRWSYGLVYSTYALLYSGTQTWIEGDATSPPLPVARIRPPGRGEVIAQYLRLGFVHILPRGLDHILFVLGIFLLSTRIRPILTQVTAFTIAHSITLGLTMYGIVSLPSRIVEPLIALSIAYVAFENVVTYELKPWRPFVVFGFGLLHGMGFAGVLRTLQLPRAEFVPALISFNAGIELGQLTVIAVAFLLTAAWFRHRSWYRQRFVVPASMAIAVTGVFWTVQRIWF